MAQNEPQRKETPPGPSPNYHHYYLNISVQAGKFIRLANRIEKNRFGSENRIESDRNFFCPNWNVLIETGLS